MSSCIEAREKYIKEPRSAMGLPGRTPRFALTKSQSPPFSPLLPRVRPGGPQLLALGAHVQLGDGRPVVEPVVERRVLGDEPAAASQHPLEHLPGDGSLRCRQR